MKFVSRACRLILRPSEEWGRIAEEMDKRRGNFFTDYFYPLVASCGLLYLCAQMWSGWIDEPFGEMGALFQTTMMETVGFFFIFIGGFYVAYYLLHNLLGASLGDGRSGYALAVLVGYSMTLPIVLQTLSCLVGAFAVLRWIFQFYTLYIVWEGSKKLMAIKDRSRMNFSLIVTLAVVFVPWIISFLYHRFIG